jgi:hypothetical protein
VSELKRLAKRIAELEAQERKRVERLGQHPQSIREACAKAEAWVDELKKENAELLAVIRDYEADAARIFSESCGPAKDEVHCSCVPPLRKRIKELEARWERVRATDRLLIELELEEVKRG